MQMIQNNYQKVIVFEDDIRFKPFFRTKLQYMMYEVSQLPYDWDLM